MPEQPRPVRRQAAARQLDPDALSLARSADLQVERIVALSQGGAIGYPEMAARFRAAFSAVFRDADKATVLSAVAVLLAMRHARSMSAVAYRRLLQRAAARREPPRKQG